MENSDVSGSPPSDNETAMVSYTLGDLSAPQSDTKSVVSDRPAEQMPEGLDITAPQEEWQLRKLAFHDNHVFLEWSFNTHFYFLQTKRYH